MLGAKFDSGWLDLMLRRQKEMTMSEREKGVPIKDWLRDEPGCPHCPETRTDISRFRYFFRTMGVTVDDCMSTSTGDLEPWDWEHKLCDGGVCVALGVAQAWFLFEEKTGRFLGVMPDECGSFEPRIERGQ